MSSALSDLFSPLVARLTGDPSASASSSSSSSSLLRGVERAAALLFAAQALHAVVFRRKELLARLTAAATALPGVKGAVAAQIAAEADKAVGDMFDEAEIFKAMPAQLALPEQGMGRDEVLRVMHELKKLDVDHTEGKAFAYAYTTAEEGHEQFLQDAYSVFMHENALNPVAFPALKRMESEVVAMSLRLLGGQPGACGSMTSGGTESILLAVKTYREYAKATRGIEEPEMVLATTAHPAFEKAAHYFQVKAVHVELADDCRVDTALMKAAVNSNTILIVVSAPQYPHGVVDPVTEMGAFAAEKDIPLHVDSCIGGFVLPFVKKLGHTVPDFDLSVPGVTSLSADLHKYGYSPKGASVLLFNDKKFQEYQYFAYASWPGGLFVSPSMLGTRGGGAIGGAWASLLAMGEAGFMQATQKIMDTRQTVIDALRADPLKETLELVVYPHSTLVAFRSKNQSKCNILAVADVMEDQYHWKMERQQNPSCLHLSLMPQHYAVREKFVADLTASVEYVLSHPELADKGSAAMYGMVANIPSGAVVEQFLTTFMGSVYAPPAGAGAGAGAGAAAAGADTN